MTTIGTFTKKDISYVGTIETLTFKAKVSLIPAAKASEKAPDYKLYKDDVEFGAAWKSKSKEGKPYLSITMDDPSFAAPLLARLVQKDKGYLLLWSR